MHCCMRVWDGPGDDARVTAGVDARAGIFDHFARRSRSTKIKGLFSFILSALGGYFETVRAVRVVFVGENTLCFLKKTVENRMTASNFSHFILCIMQERERLFFVSRL